jgi:hypothetical protein
LHGHSLGSVGDSEESSNERDLTRDVALLYPPSLSLANHVHSLNTLDRPTGRVE